MRFVNKPYAALSLDELYALLRLRQDIFIVEQRCHYLDCDGLDQGAEHILGYVTAGELVACARILPPGTAYSQDTASIGRVALAKAHRGRGLGEALMREAMMRCRRLHPGAITISAQVHAIPFYTKLGFVVTSEPYEDAGVLHVKMVA